MSQTAIEVQDENGNTELLTLQEFIEKAPRNYRMTVINHVASGQIRAEVGSDGIYVIFDCDCLDALPICKAACCALPGTFVREDEIPGLMEVATEIQRNIVVNKPERHGNDIYQYQMKRDADGFCSCLDREKRLCQIYDDRPRVCQDFHCSRGVNRGFKLILSKQHEYMLG